MTEEKGLLGKGYLIGLGIALVILLFSPTNRQFIRRHIPLPSFGSTPGRTAAEDDGEVHEDLEPFRRNAQAFNEWLMSEETAPVATIEIVRGPQVVETGPPPDPDKPDPLWPVPIVGTAGSEEAGWQAIWGSRTLEPGSLIAPPTSDRVGYQVLHVGRRSVWLVAQYETDPLEVPLVAWPDLRGIRTSADGGVRPTRIEIRRGEFLYPGEGLRFVDGDQVVLKRLWRTAAHFQYQFATGAAPLDLVCIVLP